MRNRAQHAEAVITYRRKSSDSIPFVIDGQCIKRRDQLLSSIETGFMTECAACRNPRMNLLDQYSNPVSRNRLARQIAPGSSRPSVRISHAPRRTLRRRARIAAPARRSNQTTAAALAFPTSIPVTFALRDMSQELEGVASCFNLVATRARPLRERMGLSLARVGVRAQHARVSGAAHPARRSGARDRRRCR